MIGPGRVLLYMGLAGVALAAGVAAASVSKADMARCAGIDAADARLACYDKLSGRVPAGPSARAPAAAAATVAAPAAPAAAAARAAPATDASSFGLTKPQPQAAPVGPQLITAQVSQVIQSRFGNVNVLLDNGQTWIVDASDVQLKSGDSVTIKRAALGSFLMLAPARRSYRVRRLE